MPDKEIEQETSMMLSKIVTVRDQTKKALLEEWFDLPLELADYVLSFVIFTTDFAGKSHTCEPLIVFPDIDAAIDYEALGESVAVLGSTIELEHYPITEDLESEVGNKHRSLRRGVSAGGGILTVYGKHTTGVLEYDVPIVLKYNVCDQQSPKTVRYPCVTWIDENEGANSTVTVDVPVVPHVVVCERDGEVLRVTVRSGHDALEFRHIEVEWSQFDPNVLHSAVSLPYSRLEPTITKRQVSRDVTAFVASIEDSQSFNVTIEIHHKPIPLPAPAN